MPNRTVDVLTKAAVLLGGVPRLALRLNVAVEDVLAWIGNKVTAPAEALATAAAIIETYEVDHTGTRLIRLEALKKHPERSG